jgi:AbrB family looped-hinge helix DNA binding protein
LGAQVKVLQKGKLTIPAEMREALGVEEGDYVTIDLEDGRLVISAPGTIANPTEAISRLASGVTVEEPLDKETVRAGATSMKRKLERGSR